MKTLKLIFAIVCFACCSWVSAQTQTEVRGDKAKIIYLTEAYGGNTFAMSSNGTYIGGFFANIGGFVYNRLTDSLQITQAAILGIANDGMLIGNYPDSATMINGEPLITASTYRNGKWIPWEYIPEYGKPHSWGEGIQARSVSDDGKITTGMSWCGNLLKYTGALWVADKFTKQLPLYWDIRQEGGLANVISGDGKINAGYCAWWKGDQQITGRVPVIWDSLGNPFVIGDTNTFQKVIQAGEVKGLNRDGSIALGSMIYKDVTTAFVWDKENDVQFLGTLPTWRGSVAMDISENGIVVGYATGFTLTGEYDGFVWTKKMGLVSLRQYLKELYGLDLGSQNMRMPMKISDDGRVIAGYTLIAGTRTPYVISLDEDVLNTRPLSLLAKQEKDALRTKLSWNLPLYNGKEILGYTIYRDSIKLNTEPFTECSYIDEGVLEGEHTYHVSTVYASGESAMSDPSRVQIIGIKGCYSVKYIQSELIYNKTAKIHWGVPTSAIALSAIQKDYADTKADVLTAANTIFFSPNPQTDAIQTKIKTPDTFDLVATYRLSPNVVMGLLKIGDFYYGSNIKEGGFTKYSLQMDVLGFVKIPNLPAVWNITTDGQYIYCGAATKFIYKVDLAEATIVGQYNTDEKVRHLCYIPELDNGNGGFELGDWGSSIFVDKKGKKISEGISLSETFGTSYHKGYIYTHQQIGTSTCTINQYKLDTKEATGLSLDPTEYPEVKALAIRGAYAAGISVITMEDSTVCLVPVIQGKDGMNTVIFIELEPMPNLKGFNIYRNEQKINTSPLQKRHFSEILTQAGEYKYQLSAVFKNDCESEKIQATTLIVEAISPCPKVNNLEVYEQNKDVNVRWANPDLYDYSVLGFNLYKDGKMILDLSKKFIFVDTMVNLGMHTYTLEAFYKNSCFASDSIQIDVNHQGICAPANSFSLEAEQTSPTQFDVQASWELPYIEAPLTLRYDNYENAMTIGLVGGGDPTVAIGWLPNQLAMYDGFYLVGIEIFLGEGATSIIPTVLVGEKVVYSKRAENLPIGEFTKIYFDQAIPIDTTKELMVGYTAKHSGNMYPIGVNSGPAQVKYGDLFTLDLITWFSAKEKLGLDANWNIAALLVKPREFNATTVQTQFVSTEIIENNRVGEIDKLQCRQKASQISYSSSDTLKLLGFDLYRDGEKINTELVTDLKYMDKNLGKGSYQYIVNTIWNTCDAKSSKVAKITLNPTVLELENAQKDLFILPNPAHDYISIAGEYEHFEIIDIYGQICLKGNAQKDKFSIATLNSGMYLVRIYSKNGVEQTRKLIVK